MINVKDIVEDLNYMDVSIIKKKYTNDQIIEGYEEMLLQHVHLIGQRLDVAYGISLGYTGTIQPSYYKSHRAGGGDIGLKISVDDEL